MIPLLLIKFLDCNISNHSYHLAKYKMELSKLWMMTLNKCIRKYCNKPKIKVNKNDHKWTNKIPKIINM